MNRPEGSKRSYPRFVTVLALLGAISTRRQIRQASYEARLVGAAILYLQALALGESRARARKRAVISMLFRAKGFDRIQFFAPGRVAAQLQLSHTTSASRIFAAWIGAGAPGDPVGWFMGGQVDNPEKAFRDLILHKIWQGHLDQPISKNGEMLAAPYAGPELPFYEFLQTVGAREFGIFRETHSANAIEVHARFRKQIGSLADRLSSGTLSELAKKAAEFEPLIMHPNRSTGTLVHPQVLEPDGPIAMRTAQTLLERRPSKTVILIPHCRMSGAARVAASLSRSLARLYSADDVVVLRTDLSQMDYPEWFAPGCRHLDFASLAGNLSPQRRQLFLLNLVRSLAPINVFNVNSRLMWDMTPDFAKVLSDQSNYYAYLFCSDINDQGVEAGYPVEFFANCFEQMTGIVTDSTFLADRLRERFLVDSRNDRLATLRTPLADTVLPVRTNPARMNGSPKVFWAGRFDRQKRIDLVYALAAQMPDVEFHLWGKAILSGPTADLKPSPNMTFHGTYGRFDELPLSDCDVWLYTSEWDGVPTILIDVATAGIPLVGSDVGGTGEVMTDDHSWLVPANADASEYEAAIRDALSDLPSACEKAAQLSHKVRTERTEEQYDAALRSFLERTGRRYG